MPTLENGLCGPGGHGHKNGKSQWILHLASPTPALHRKPTPTCLLYPAGDGNWALPIPQGMGTANHLDTHTCVHWQVAGLAHTATI